MSPARQGFTLLEVLVALVVLAHQVTIHNLITRANYKSRRFVTHEIDPARNPNPTWADI